MSRPRSSRCVSRAVVIRLNAVLIRPNSSEDVTGSWVVFPWAIAWVASVRAVTGAVIRLDNQKARKHGDAGRQHAANEGDVKERGEKPVRLGGEEPLVHVHVDVAYGPVRSQIEHRLTMPVQSGRDIGSG